MAEVLRPRVRVAGILIEDDKILLIEHLKKELIDIDQEIKDLESFERLYNLGDKVAQFCFLPKYEWNYVLTETLPETIRGEGGFGSTTLKAKTTPKSKNNVKKSRKQ